jgi:hypothetical protein
MIPKNAFGWPACSDPVGILAGFASPAIPLLLRDERWGLSLVPFPNFQFPISNFYLALLLPLNGLNIASDLSQVRKVVTGQQSQHHAQGLRAALIVLADALQILR